MRMRTVLLSALVVCFAIGGILVQEAQSSPPPAIENTRLVLYFDALTQEVDAVSSTTNFTYKPGGGDPQNVDFHIYLLAHYSGDTEGYVTLNHSTGDNTANATVTKNLGCTQLPAIPANTQYDGYYAVDIYIFTDGNLDVQAECFDVLSVSRFSNNAFKHQVPFGTGSSDWNPWCHTFYDAEQSVLHIDEWFEVCGEVDVISGLELVVEEWIGTPWGGAWTAIGTYPIEPADDYAEGWRTILVPITKPGWWPTDAVDIRTKYRWTDGNPAVVHQSYWAESEY